MSRFISPWVRSGRRFSAAAATVALSALAVAVSVHPGAPAPAWAAGPLNGTGGMPGTVRVTNVNSAAFSVSWVSTDAVTGAVRYGVTPGALTNVAEDDLAGARRTHHASPWPLSENTLYYYDILVGSGVDDNGGVHYLLTTGPSPQSIPGPGEQVWGSVVTAGVPTSGVLVYALIQSTDGSNSAGESAPLSLLTTDSYWGFSTGSFLEADLGAPFSYVSATDRLRLDAQGNPEGQATDVLTISQAVYPLSRTVTLSAGILPPPADPAPLPGPSGPDLVIDSLQYLLNYPTAGCSANFTVTVRNVGDVTAVAPFRVALYLDHSRVPYSGERSNTNTFWVIGSDLGPSASVALSSLSPYTTSGVISQLPAAGNHTLYARADSYNNQVAELDEANNLHGPITVTAVGDCLKRIYLPLVLRNN